MPHTCIMQYIGIEHTNCAYTRNRCCSVILLLFETVRFLCKDCENTFYVCCLGNYMPFSTTKLENYSQMNNTRWDIVFKK